MSSPILPPVNKSIKKAIVKNIFIPDIGGGASVAPITRNFITFSSMDGGHAVPSSPIALQAGDKVIAKTMLKAGTSHRWIFNYAADTSDPRRFILFLNASSGGVVHYQSSLASEVRVDSVAIANVSQTYIDADLHTVEIDISGDALIDKIGNHDQVFESLKVVRNGQLYHDFDFNVDSSTDTIVDSAGSNITFSLVNVLPALRVHYTFDDVNQNWSTENLWPFDAGIFDGTGVAWWPPVAAVNIDDGFYSIDINAANVAGSWQFSVPTPATMTSKTSNAISYQNSDSGVLTGGTIRLYDVVGGTTADSYTVDLRKILRSAQ